ncbi:MAG: beta-N-acetylhexosaminidase [Chitinophagaceae bacterium]|nr:MAG: beta-N-acetylhexosaminidase [Chitinophagaceae bacterium]
MRFILFLLIACIAVPSMGQQVSIIPEPVYLKVNKGVFRISKSTKIVLIDKRDEPAASFLNDYIENVYGFRLATSSNPATRSITLVTKKFIKAPDADAYQLTSTATGVRIEGDTYAGTFHGIQTLIQLLPTTQQTTLSIPLVVVKDSPRFDYRGMMLDVCRHFFPVPMVKKFIDYLALHKLNRFHWHLTDDQGWRIEIKKYPRLTEVGGYRNGTITGRFPGTGNTNTRYGGFYTQEQIKEVVKYAADRFITVVPEIEMPGHGSAAIAAYPELSCFPEVPTIRYFPPKCTWGVFDDVFCAGKENTFAFLEDVISEVLPLFPSQYIHVGGDECPKKNWEKCPNCQKRMKENNLKNEHELQSYFVQRMEKYINGKGRTLIGWDEILEGGLAPNAAVMSWRGEKGGIEAARMKHTVVMSPTTYLYFDYKQVEVEDSLTIGGNLPLEKVYSYEPYPAELTADEAKMITGVQANLWTEYITKFEKIEYMVFPRMEALSEIAWSGKDKKDWAKFEKKLPAQFKRYDLWKANYHKFYYKQKVKDSTHRPE